MENRQQPNTRKRKRNEEDVFFTEAGASNYMLRSKKKISNCAPKCTESTTNALRKSSKIQLLERIRLEIPTKDYLINEIVLTTIPGYKPWPSRILNITGQTITVEFFGTGEM